MALLIVKICNPKIWVGTDKVYHNLRWVVWQSKSQSDQFLTNNRSGVSEFRPGSRTSLAISRCMLRISHIEIWEPECLRVKSGLKGYKVGRELSTFEPKFLPKYRPCCSRSVITAAPFDLRISSPRQIG
jgi:hypothetical protein